jgi:alanine dehydrogenase
MESQNTPGGGLPTLGGSLISELISMREALEVTERAFRLRASGQTVMPPKLYLELAAYGGDFRAMPAFIDGAAGLKWVSVYPENQQRGLPTVMATIILSDPASGRTLAVMDGTFITNLRTGAAGGVAVKYLARKDTSVIGLVGAGAQARSQLLAINEVVAHISEVRVFDARADASRRYAEEMGARLGLRIRPVATASEAAQADIVVTTTPSRAPIVMAADIKPGTHINAIGADAPGKQELEPEILLRAGKIVVDDREQAAHSGEVNVPLSQRLINRARIYASLGEVVLGTKQGRQSEDEITVFDSTGLAILDIACAKLAYDKARARGLVPG